MSSVITSSEALKPSRANSRVPSHLYNRNGLYYFRIVFPDELRQKFGKRELRISLRTAFRRLALKISESLYYLYSEMVKYHSMLDYKELRRRLRIYP